MKSWLIMFNVGSNTASRMAGTCWESRAYVRMTISTPGGYVKGLRSG